MGISWSMPVEWEEWAILIVGRVCSVILDVQVIDFRVVRGGRVTRTELGE